MSRVFENIKQYAPNLLLDRLAQDPSRTAAPISESFPAAVMFADISGFTQLTERFTRGNPEGVRELANVLDIYIGKLVELINGHGGDVVKFAGDALFAVWRSDVAGLPLETHRATRCGLIIQQKLHNFKVASGVNLSLTVAIGAGEQLHSLHLGGTFERWELLIAGDPMNQVGAGSKIAEPGQVAISPQAWKYLRDIGGGTPAGNGKFLLKETDISVALAKPDVPIEAEQALRSYVPRAIITRLEEGKDAWTAQLKQVTVLFLKVTGFSYTSETPLDDVQKIMKVMQNSLYSHEGSINRFGVDDKGAILLAAFGLPPLDHDDDPLRGVYAANDLRQILTRIGRGCKVGITTGTVFCGTVGNTIRAEYTMHGWQINLAARLMQAADTILCDEKTYELSHDKVKFEKQPPLKVKGRDEPVTVYKPIF